MDRPKVDESLCFICQEFPPTKILTRGKEEFKLCAVCCRTAEQENRMRNMLKQEIFRSQAGKIFTMVLGADLLPTKISIKDI